MKRLRSGNMDFIGSGKEICHLFRKLKGFQPLKQHYKEEILLFKDNTIVSLWLALGNTNCSWDLEEIYNYCQDKAMELVNNNDVDWAFSHHCNIDLAYRWKDFKNSAKQRSDKAMTR